MSQYKDPELGSTVYFWFAANDTGGSAADGTGELYYVRLAGALASAAPTASGTPSLLSHASYPAGLYEVAHDTTGLAESSEYAVFCQLTVDSENPGGIVGSFKVKPVGDSLDSAAARLADISTASQINTVGTVTSVTNTVSSQVVSVNANALTASALAGDAASEIATALLDADWASYEAGAESGTTLGGAVALMRAAIAGRIAISGTTLTVYEADGTTVIATYTIASDYSTRSVPS